MALAGAALLGVSTPATAAPDAPNPFVPFDQATIIDPDTVTPAKGGLLTADGTNVCAVNPYSIVYPSGTYACFADDGHAFPGKIIPIDPPVLVPFDQATVVDPNAVTIVPGGVITPDGTDLCVDNPGSIVFPDGRYPCYINFVQTYGVVPPLEGGTENAPQVAEMPVGGADTGVEGISGPGVASGSVLSSGLLGGGILAAGAALALQTRRRH